MLKYLMMTATVITLMGCASKIQEETSMYKAQSLKTTVEIESYKYIVRPQNMSGDIWFANQKFDRKTNTQFMPHALMAIEQVTGCKIIDNTAQRIVATMMRANVECDDRTKIDAILSGA